MTKMNILKNDVLKYLFLIMLVALMLLSTRIVTASEPVRIRVISADPNTRTYSFICADNGSGLAGNGVRNWFIYPEDTGVDELITNLPANQSLTYTFLRDAYYDITCNDPNPPGLNYTSLYRHSMHIDLRTQLANPAVIPLSVGPGQVTEKCVYNGTNYSISWFLSTYGFAGGSGNTVRYSLNDTTNTITFNAPFAPSLFDTHCLIHFTDGRKDIDIPTGIDFPTSTTSAPYIADKYGISLAGNFAPFNYNTWISQHNGVNSTNITTGNQTNNQSNSTTTNLTGNLNVTTTPSGASVNINGAFMGLTGSNGKLFVSQVVPGFDLVIISFAGYNSYVNTVNVIANQTLNLNILLQPINNVTNSSNTSTYFTVKDIPTKCVGGIISSDIYSGGRTITCANGTNNLSITAWNKPTNTAPQYFEMYKKSQAGTGLQICLLGTCISSNGYAKSPNFPITG